MRAENEEDLCQSCMHSFQTVADVGCQCKVVSRKKTNLLTVSGVYVIKDNFRIGEDAKLIVQKKRRI